MSRIAIYSHSNSKGWFNFSQQVVFIFTNNSFVFKKWAVGFIMKMDKEKS